MISSIRHETVLLAVVLAITLVFSSALVASDKAIKQFEIQVNSPPFVQQGDALITHADIDAFLQGIPEGDRFSFLSSPDRIARMLGNLLVTESFARLAIKDGFVEDEVVQASLYRTVVTEVAQMYREQFLSSLELEDYSAVARELYLAEDALFRAPTEVDFRHILITVTADRPEPDAMKKIVDVYERLRSGDDFGELAIKYSDDPNASSNSGLYTGVRFDDLERAISSYMLSMEEGQVTEPIRTSFGWHVVKLERLNTDRRLSWEEAEDLAIQTARSRHLTRAMERKLRELQEDPVSFSEGAVAALRERYSSSSNGHELRANEAEILRALEEEALELQ